MFIRMLFLVFECWFGERQFVARYDLLFEKLPDRLAAFVAKMRNRRFYAAAFSCLFQTLLQTETCIEHPN